MTKFNLFAILVSAILAITATAEHSFPVYRLFQYDKLDSHNYSQIGRYGARRTGCEGTPIYWYDVLSETANPNATLHRKIVIIDSTDATHPLTSDLIPALVPKLNARGASGLLLLVPKNTRLFTSEQLESWVQLERQLVQSPEINCAAYIAFKEDASKIRSDLSLTVAERKGLMVASENPKIRTIVSTLHGGKSAEDPDTRGLALPTIAIVAHYDTFSLAPALGVAADASGSSVAVLLELLRGFSKLYGAKAATPAYNLAFVLAGGAPLNYAGVRHWAEHIPVESPVEFALCLDTITLMNPLRSDLFTSEKYYLHISKPPKDAAVARFYNAFERAAKSLGIKNFELVHKKINVAKPEADWPHEALAMKRVLSATLSMLPTPPAGSAESLLARSSIMDRSPASQEKIALASRLIAEALARIVYPRAAELTSDDVTLIHDDVIGDDVSVRRMTEWSAELAKTARPMPAASSEGSPVFDALLRTMKERCADTEVDDVTYVTSKKGARKQAAAEAKKNKKNKGKKNDVTSTFEDDEEDELISDEKDFVMKFYVTPNGFKKADLRMTVHKRAPLLWNLYVLIITVGFLAASSSFILKKVKSKSD